MFMFGLVYFACNAISSIIFVKCNEIGRVKNKKLLKKRWFSAGCWL